MGEVGRSGPLEPSIPTDEPPDLIALPLGNGPPMLAEETSTVLGALGSRSPAIYSQIFPHTSNMLPFI